MVKIFCRYCVLFSLLIPPAYAYIDPGTGSMLLSMILCSVTTLCFLFNLCILKLKRLFFSKKDLLKGFYPFVIYSEGNQYYSVFKPILDEFEKREIPLMYYTSAQNDKFFEENFKNIKIEYIGNGYKAFFKLAFLKADVCLLTIPQLDVLQLKRSKYTKHYCHIFHSIGISMDYRMFALDYYDSVLCDAKFQIPLIRETEMKRNTPAKELVVVGSTYMDYNKKRAEAEKSIKDQGKYTVLIAPSWGEHSLIYKFGDKLLKNLLKTDYNIIIRPHPQSMTSDKKILQNLQEKYKNTSQLNWDYASDNIISMSKADIMISDFSCIMFDYAFLFKKPFLYINTDINFEALDCCDLDELPPWRYQIMNKIGREIKSENGDIDNISQIIEQMKNNKNIEHEISKICDYAWEQKGEAAKNILDYLIKVQKELNKDV